MGISLSSPVTGSAQTGLTSPTYTIVADTAPDSNGKQYAVSALGGTQTGVVAHSVSKPFTVTFWRAKVLRLIGRINSVGYLVGNPTNTHKVITRKGVVPLVNQQAELMTISTTITIPAGAESYDEVNVRAALSCHIGSLSQVSSAIGDLANNGVL